MSMPRSLSPSAAKNAALVRSRTIRMAENVAGLVSPAERRNTSTMRPHANLVTGDGGQMKIKLVGIFMKNSLLNQ